ncbi:hypothetical protein [Bradyrhizobium sp. ORS 375]|uniref:hypothetical protein n=1 Tax=Bradyrhizobium sp. (strain ORS 375) TaxID=566679 RepID=UPI0005516E6A|nr:hypothetical protein [Bradyrhizobium sp. ORS 375]
MAIGFRGRGFARPLRKYNIDEESQLSRPEKIHYWEVEIRTDRPGLVVTRAPIPKFDSVCMHRGSRILGIEVDSMASLSSCLEDEVPVAAIGLTNPVFVFGAAVETVLA